MPWDAGVSARPASRASPPTAIDVVIETGDSGPITPIGINLPNDQTVREEYGSKSVSLSNVTEAYDKSTVPGVPQRVRVGAGGSGARREVERVRRRADDQHARGDRPRLGQGQRHGSAATQRRCSRSSTRRSKRPAPTWSALYFIADPKLVELGLVPAADQAEIVQAEYEGYTRNALVQLRRIREGTQIEEDHMRNRQMIVRWLMANTKAIEVRQRDGKTYYVMIDAQAFRDGVGRLLAEVQRIKAEGDYAAAKALFETYGVHFDPALRDEVVARVDRLKLPSYTGFVMPKLDGGDATPTAPSPT